MKRMYITGAALILLAIIITTGVIINRNENGKTNNNNTAAAQTGPTETAIDNTSGGNTQNSPVADNNTNAATETTEAPATYKPRRRARHRHFDVAATGYYDQQGPVASAGIVINASNPTIVFGTERSKDYFGNNETPARHKTHRPFHLPNGLGIEIGYNQSSLYNNQTGNMAIGNVNVGLLGNFDMGDHFAFQPGIRYISKGNRLESDMDVSTNEKLSLHYLEVPADLVVKFGKVGDARFMIGAGPYAAYLLGAKDKFQSPGYSDGADVIPPSSPQYSVNNVNNFDWGLNGFIGVQSPEGLFLKAGAEAGMMDIIKNLDGSYSNRNYSMMVSFGFIMGAK